MSVIPVNTVFVAESATAESELTLNELADKINALREVPTLEQIKEWFSQLVIRQRDYDRFCVFDERHYARNLIARSPFAELLLLCWRAGQRTPIHDHGGSVGVVMVYEGLLTETLFDQMPEGHVRPFNTFKWSAGGITGADVPDIHQLLNLQGEGKNLVTLHCYAPPLAEMNKYSPRSSAVAKWREGYFAGGAGI